MVHGLAVQGEEARSILFPDKLSNIRIGLRCAKLMAFGTNNTPAAQNEAQVHQLDIFHKKRSDT